MSDHTPSDDELISAYLDGEATTDEIARVESEPALRARLHQMGAAVELVAAPVEPLRSGELDRILGVALEQSSTSDDVIDLRAATARRRVRQRLVTSAAAVLVIAVAVPALLAVNGLTNDDDDTGDAVAADTGDDSADAGDDGFDFLDDDDMGAAEAEAEAAAPVDDATSTLQGDDVAADALNAGDAAADDGAARAYEELALLPADIGDVADTDALTALVSDAWSSYRSGDDADEGLADPSATDESVPALPCGPEILAFVAAATPASDLELDVRLVGIGGEPFTIAVAALDEATATLVIASHDGCVASGIDIVG